MGNANLGLILSFISGIISLGAVSSVVFFRYRRKSEKLKPQNEGMDIADKASKYAESVMDEVGKWHEKVNALYEESGKMKQEITELKYLLDMNGRKIAGIQETLRRQIGRKKYAEKHICTVLDCKLRQPPFGSFTSEDGDAIERYVNLNNRVRKGRNNEQK